MKKKQNKEQKCLLMLFCPFFFYIYYISCRKKKINKKPRVFHFHFCLLFLLLSMFTLVRQHLKEHEKQTGSDSLNSMRLIVHADMPFSYCLCIATFQLKRVCTSVYMFVSACGFFFLSSFFFIFVCVILFSKVYKHAHSCCRLGKQLCNIL